MVDVEKLVTHWRNGALSSWDDALYLLEGKRVMLGMFAVHLALEKALKAHLSISPRTISMEARMATRSATRCPFTICDSTLKLSNEGVRI